MTGEPVARSPVHGVARPNEEIDAGPVTLVRFRGDESAVLLRAVVDSLDHLRPWMPWAARAPTLEEQDQYVRGALPQWDSGDGFQYWLREKASGELVGGAGLHRRIGQRGLEIGYWVRADRARRGYATAAARALTAAAFALGWVDRVEIHCDEANVASAGVPRRLGFRLDRIEDDTVEAPGETGRSMIWVAEAGTWGGS